METMNPMSDIEHMTVHYDGQALQTHEIDVKELGTSLLGIATMFETAQETIEPKTKLKVNMKATREGSVEIDLIVRLFNDATALFNSAPITAICNVTALAGIVFGAIKIIKHEAQTHVHPQTIEKLKDTKTDTTEDIVIEFPDGTKITTSQYSVELSQNSTFIRATKNATEPVLQNGINSIAFKVKDHVETITTEDAEIIHDYSIEQKDTSISTEEIDVQVLDISFRETGKWRVTDGTKKQFVTIEDKAFLKRIQDGSELFSSQDLYHVRMRIERSFNDDGVLTKKLIAIEEVLAHKHREQQMSLFD